MLTYFIKHYSREGVVGSAIKLRGGRSRVKMPEWAAEFYILRNVWSGYGAYPAPYWMGPVVVCPEKSCRSMKLTPHLHLSSRLRTYEAIYLFPGAGWDSSTWNLDLFVSVWQCYTWIRFSFTPFRDVLFLCIAYYRNVFFFWCGLAVCVTDVFILVTCIDSQNYFVLSARIL